MFDAKAYYQRPEVKERQKAWRKEYHQRPEVKERRKAYYRRYRETHPELRQKARESSRRYYYNPIPIIRDSRRQFEQLCEKDENEARLLVEEMESEEGKNFRELLLNGIPEKKLFH